MQGLESVVACHGVAVLSEGPPEFAGHGLGHKGLQAHTKNRRD